jgi:hypothetical protein
VPPPASTSAWLNVPPAPVQSPPQGQPYPPQAQPYRGQFQARTDGGAIASLILGIASIALCLSVFAGIPAIILGHISYSKIKKSMGRLKGEGMALAGLILGYISLPMVLIFAAVLIPNLLRAKMSANEAAAASTVRTINTSQITYSTKFPEHGYAADLASLGPEPGGSCSGEGTAEHACLLDNVLGGPRCTAGQWCSKNGYKYSVSAVCESGAACTNYVVTATPLVFGSTGRKSFCATSDAVIRYRFMGESRAAPLTADECAEWPPIT